MQIRKVWSLLLLLIFTAEMGSKTLLLLDYELRLDYYAGELCIRKQVENNSCQGMCHLSKEIKKEEEREKERGHAFNVKYDFIFLSYTDELKMQIYSDTRPETGESIIMLRGGFPLDVFRPPLA